MKKVLASADSKLNVVFLIQLILSTFDSKLVNKDLEINKVISMYSITVCGSSRFISLFSPIVHFSVNGHL